MDDQQRAREQFEEWILSVYQVDLGRRGDVYLDTTVGVAWDSWNAALRAAPEGFVMVPEMATEAMLSAAFPRNERIDAEFDRQGAWADCLAARPQGVKDA